MSADAIVGASWGDEGKGKMIDFMAGQADMVVRFQGGQNAGHTIINSFGKFVMHLLPSGVFYPDVVNVLGPGVAFDIRGFLSELEALKAKGIAEPRVFVSDRAQIVMPYHILMEKYEEERLSSDSFGSTLKGIAPFYGDKYLKTGIQIADLYDDDYLLERIERSLIQKNILFEYLYHQTPITVQDLLDGLRKERELIKPYITDTTKIIRQALEENKKILLEGQLGSLKDPDHGIYPYPTSSSPLAGFACVGAGISPRSIKRIVAVAKAYSTCVGAGPFVTEIFGKEADELRNRGGDSGEFGATTGRPRRIGWFDAVAIRYGCRVQGATEIALTMLDVLKYLDKIPICIAYEIEGTRTEDFPVTLRLKKAKPVYETMKGWKCDISKVRDFDDLPSGARDYVNRIEELVQVPIRWISIGPQRDAVFERM